ncbi:MAG: hypothetical protein LBL00_04480, partial [Endomicrobium sp.]|nr:hypothetical protein [Endomicrobium sp.]
MISTPLEIKFLDIIAYLKNTAGNDDNGNNARLRTSGMTTKMISLVCHSRRFLSGIHFVFSL